MQKGNDNLRIGLCLWWTASNPMSSLFFVSLSLIREWSKMFTGQLVVFYDASERQFSEKLTEFSYVTGHGLRHLVDICQYRHEIDVLYTPYWWSEIDMDGLPQVHFIPDLTYVFYPTHQTKRYVEHFILACKHAVGISQYIIVPSEFTKKTIEQQFGLPENKIRVVHHGVHPIFLDESSGGLRPNHLPRSATDYLFFPANPLKRKNHRVLLDALVFLRERYSFEPHCLFAGDGTPDPQGIDLQREILERGLSETVHHLGLVSLTELKYLYANAKALIFPSLFEGFGIPVLEAMTLGCPVIASNRTCIPEIAQDAALYFDPQDPSDLADTIFRFYKDPGIAGRLIPEGKKRARDFSEARQALETLTVLKEAYGDAKADLARRSAMINELICRAPIMTLILFFRRSAYRQLVQELDKLIRVVGQAIEIVWIVAPRDAHFLDERPSTEKRMSYGINLCDSISAVLGQTSATFVFFSSGEALPLPSFVFFLIKRLGSREIHGNFLHGEVYFKDGVVNVIRSSVHFYSIREDLERDYCYHYLPFVVSKEALQAVVNNLESSPDSLPGLAVLLFDNCKRERLFIPISAKVAEVRPRETPHSAILLSRLKREFIKGRQLFRLLNHPLLRHWTLRSLDAYVGLSQPVRSVFRFLAKIVWHKRAETE